MSLVSTLRMFLEEVKIGECCCMIDVKPVFGTDARRDIIEFAIIFTNSWTFHMIGRLQIQKPSPQMVTVFTVLLVGNMKH